MLNIVYESNQHMDMDLTQTELIWIQFSCF